MTNVLIASITRIWTYHRDYVQRLLADLRPDEMIARPAPIDGVAMNHPAWIVSHLAVYPPILACMLRGEHFDDPIDLPHGRNSKPVDDAAAYVPKDLLLAQYIDVHDAADEAIRQVSDERLAALTPLERWRERFPRIGDATLHLTMHHEAIHIGQLSAWRRAMGKPAV